MLRSQQEMQFQSPGLQRLTEMPFDKQSHIAQHSTIVRAVVATGSLFKGNPVETTPIIGHCRFTYYQEIVCFQMIIRNDLL